MSTLWSSSFAIQSQFLSPSQRQWLRYDAQGVNRPPLWSVPSYSQYHQPAAAIVKLDSTPSSPSGGKKASSPTKEDVKSPPTIAPSLEKAKPRRKRPPTAKTPLAVNKALPAPPPKRSVQRPTKPQQVQSKELTHFITQHPATFSVVSASALKRERPAVWRDDYLPPSASWLKRRVVALRTMLADESTYLQGVRYTLNSLLRHSSSPPSTYFFDLRCNPFSAYILHLPHSRGPINHLHLLQVATTPPLYEMHFWHPRLPWTIVVRSTRSNGILISDVLGNIYSQLMLPIGSQDYYNQDMTAEDRERIETTYKVRCNGAVGLLRAGILRLDFLGSDVGFVGLSRSWNGMWEIRTVDINQTEVERIALPST